MLDAVYIETKKIKSIIALKPKPAFRPNLQVAVSKKNANIRILNEPLQGSSVFMVETGEVQSQRGTRLKGMNYLQQPLLAVCPG